MCLATTLAFDSRDPAGSLDDWRNSDAKGAFRERGIGIA